MSGKKITKGVIDKFSARLSELDSFVEECVGLTDLPGIAISVNIMSGSPIVPEGYNFHRTIGKANILTGRELEDSSVFHCASVSKTFTGTGIMQLVQDKKLNLEDNIEDVMPELAIAAPQFGKIRIWEMMSHTSGMGDVNDYQWNCPRLDEDALRDYVLSTEVTSSSLLWAPSEGKFSYSNIAYEILGAIISRYSGMSFEDYMMKRIIEPAGMTNSTFYTPGRISGQFGLENIDKTTMAMPHYKGSDRSIVIAEDYPYNRSHGPSSTLTSTLSDLDLWASSHVDNTLLNRELYEKIWSPVTTVPNNHERMGLSWFIRRQGGYTLYGHEGTDDGFRASFWLCPELKLNITVLSNMSGAPVKKLNKQIFSHLLV